MQRQALSQRLAADVDHGLGAACRGIRARARLPASRPAPGSGWPRSLRRPPTCRWWWMPWRRSYRQEATRRTGWPVTRWLVRFRPDPLRRLNLRRTQSAAGAEPDLAAAGRGPGTGQDRRGRAGVRGRRRPTAPRGPGARSSAARPARAGSSSRTRWTRRLPAPISSRAQSWWWTAFNVVQWLGLLVAAGGLGWLGVLAGAGLLPAARAGDSQGGGLAGAHRHGGRGSAAGHRAGPRGEIDCRRRCRVPVRRPPGSGSRPPSPPSRRNWWSSRWNWRSAGSSPSTPRLKPRQAEPAAQPVPELRGVADLDQGAQVARGGAGLVLGLGGELAEGAVEGAAGGASHATASGPSRVSSTPSRARAGVVTARRVSRRPRRA